ncbi:MAG: DUF6273 domain-containing protein [Eubacteriales bacterium]|nr:DUF6273 domain-containing protein [Eubacteriales bacterium]
MVMYKCKMCGGTLEINNNETVATCEYCGTQQTLPRLDDDRRANLYDRANHFRRNNEFDKAMGIYERILNEDNTDAEAYWSLVLCSYGIEYVEDPSSHKRIPTVNRAQFTSVFDDDNYKSALLYADRYQRSIYEEEAKAINEIQKGILAISQKEEPFDVFICYKETDNNGRRTPDSVLANELYHELTKEGFKVFFARITLEDKIGSAYEPYIFAALNSAKVMVVLGTKPEFFTAVWVRNEWSRYLGLIKQGKKKMLIPAYKDMDPYDLPEEFSHLQAQDMSKLGFMQDLIRGIKKIIQAEEPKVTAVKETVIASGNVNIAPLLKRVFMFLEDGDWKSADEYCEKVLDVDPENALAYLGKLLSELKVEKQELLKYEVEPFDESNNYQKVMRFADEKLKTELISYIEHINIRNENARIESIYNRAKIVMEAADTEGAYKEAGDLFESVREYLDSAALAQSCYEKAETARKDAILADGKDKMIREGISNYEKAMKLFESIAGWKDADENAYSCKQKIEEIKEKEAERERKIQFARKEAERIVKRNKKIVMITTPIICAIIVFIIILNGIILPDIKYNNAVGQIEKGNIVEAYETLMALDGYKDSADKANSIYDKYKIEKLKDVKVGDYIYFGAYKQSNNTSNDKENIEWLVLDIKDGKALVISKYALDCKPYNTSEADVTWETCSLRKWLNDDFINIAFSAEEKAMIPTVTVPNDKNPEYSTNPGNDTRDKVFLLSVAETNKYFSSDSTKQCEPTKYAVAQGVHVDNSIGNACWWLRSIGGYQSGAVCIENYGDVTERGVSVDEADNAVRPALWIDLNS